MINLFEPLEQRNSNAYAEAYVHFYTDIISLNAWLFDEDFGQNFPMEVNFVPMLHPTNEGKIFIAEKAAFNSLADFLRTEFYRGLAIGNAPRRRNCGRCFLLTSGCNVCYCNNIAPGETNRTCQKAGAHCKEAQGKANCTPAQKEFRTCNRLKGRKQRMNGTPLRQALKRHRIWQNVENCRAGKRGVGLRCFECRYGFPITNSTEAGSIEARLCCTVNPGPHRYWR